MFIGMGVRMVGETRPASRKGFCMVGSRDDVTAAVSALIIAPDHGEESESMHSLVSRRLERRCGLHAHTRSPFFMSLLRSTRQLSNTGVPAHECISSPGSHRIS